MNQDIVRSTEPDQPCEMNGSKAQVIGVGAKFGGIEIAPSLPVARQATVHQLAMIMKLHYSLQEQSSRLIGSPQVPAVPSAHLLRPKRRRDRRRGLC